MACGCVVVWLCGCVVGFVMFFIFFNAVCFCGGVKWTVCSGAWCNVEDYNSGTCG